MTILFYIYLCFVALAFAASLLRFRSLPAHLKLLSILLGICLLTELMAMPFLKYLHMSSNNPIYNCYLLLECGVFAWYYKMIITSGLIRKIIVVFLILVPVFWLVTTFFVFGFSKWNSYMAVLESLSLVCFSTAYYRQLLLSDKTVRLSRHPEFWIATALIVFYACNLPYLGMLDYLVKNFRSLSKMLLQLLQVLNIIMYSLISYAFLCRTITRKYSLSS